MEFEKINGTVIKDDDTEENNLDLREQVEKYLRHWKWFALAVLISFIYTYFNLNFERNSYQAVSKIKIKDENGGDKSALSAFQDMGIMTAATKDNIDDEIEVLASKTLVAEVIASLKLNIQFFTNKNALSKFLDDNLGFNTEFYEDENYENPPLNLNFFISDSALSKVASEFIITVNSANQYTFSTTDKSVVKTQSFGEKITTNFGDVIILPNVDFEENNLIGSNILVSISPVKDLTNAYLGGIEIQTVAQFSNVLTLAAEDSNKKKAEDFLNELVERYNLRAIRLKEELSESTSEFVSERLKKISIELADADEEVEGVKSKYGVSTAASSAGVNIQAAKQIEQQKNMTSTQLDQIKQMKQFVATKNENEYIPSGGINDQGVANNVAKYNELLTEKKRLLKNNTEKNPVVVELSDQIKSLGSSINQGIQNVESSTQIAFDNYAQEYNTAQGRIYGAPIQETLIRDVTRKQQTKEALYLYLLQKREETAITLGVADPNAKIIDKAESLPGKVGPKKKIAFIFAILIGLLIPFSILYLIDILDSKIHTREDIEKTLSIPIIADIPKLEGKNTRYLIKKEDHSGVAEAFRILRTNISFILPKSSSSKIGKVVFVTSSIAHEGKSLVSTNLATALSHAGKKTIILGMDIRAPKLEPYLGVRSKVGVTNYIINNDISPKDIVISAPNNDNLDIVSSGDLAPNPAELLMNERVKELIDFAKENYDYVIVDTAAYSMVTDTLLLSKFADAFIYVIRANFLDKRMLKYINFLHKEKRLPNMALLLNAVDQKKTYGYGYGYGYGTGMDNAKKPWWKFGNS